MGRYRIKPRNVREKAAVMMARPRPYSGWLRVLLPALCFFGRAKRYTSQENDAQGRIKVRLTGYAYKGTVYMTKEETWEYPDPKAYDKMVKANAEAYLKAEKNRPKLTGVTAVEP